MDLKTPAAALLDNNNINDKDKDKKEKINVKIIKTLLLPGLFKYIIINETYRAKNLRIRN